MSGLFQSQSSLTVTVIEFHLQADNLHLHQNKLPLLFGQNLLYNLCLVLRSQ